MKKIILWTVSAALLVLLIIGASVLYNNLSQDFDRNSLIDTDASGTADESDTKESEESDTKDSEESEDTEASASTSATDDTEPTVDDEPFASPDFTVTDVNGKAVNLSDMKGRPIVLNFWASWCGGCNMEMPDFETVYKEYGDKVVFMMVNASDTVEAAKDYITENGFTFPIYFDTTYSAASAYHLLYLPTTFIFDEKGNISYDMVSAIDAQTLRNELEKVLK